MSLDINKCRLYYAIYSVMKEFKGHKLATVTEEHGKR